MNLGGGVRRMRGMSEMKDMAVIGLVGGVGAGKSTVAARLAQLGCEVIDADELGHEVLEWDQVREAVASRWPEVAGEGGRIDRRALGRIVFADAGALAALNAMMHPAMGEEIARRISAARERAEVTAVVLDAAVLFEAGWETMCTAVVFVDAPPEARAAHVAAERGWDESAWRARENSQISLDTKRAKCHYQIGNHSELAYLNKQIDELLHRIVCSH